MCACYLRVIARLIILKNITTAHKNTMFMKHKKECTTLSPWIGFPNIRDHYDCFSDQRIGGIYEKKFYCYSILAMRFLSMNLI
jgi:hypothetical protein